MIGMIVEFGLKANAEDTVIRDMKTGFRYLPKTNSLSESMVVEFQGVSAG